jgi:hypothetical protein
LVQITSDIELSGAGCTTAITPNQLVQSSSENDNTGFMAAAWMPDKPPFAEQSAGLR